MLLIVQRERADRGGDHEDGVSASGRSDGVTPACSSTRPVKSAQGIDARSACVCHPQAADAVQSLQGLLLLIQLVGDLTQAVMIFTVSFS